MSRRIARENAIQFLYSIDINQGETAETLMRTFFNSINLSDEDEDITEIRGRDREFAEELISGTLEKLDEIDKKIEENSIGWKRERIAKVDLAILRLAMYEILYRDDIPDSVTANEAIELAKKFSTDESSSFINGILGKAIREKIPTGV